MKKLYTDERKDKWNKFCSENDIEDLDCLNKESDEFENEKIIDFHLN